MAALECAPTPLFEAHVCLRLCRLYTQTGHLKKASQFREQAKADLERVQGKTNPAALRPLLAFYDLASAWLLYEQGKTSDALQTIQSFIAGAKYISSLQNALCEAWTLQADLLSVLYSYPEAIAAYQKALECTDSTPENWRPLRKALILNNLADVYEGAEDFENANRIYLDAMDQLDRLKDEHIVDLSACHLEILLSFANCLIQQEEMDDSIQQLAHHPLLNKKTAKRNAPLTMLLAIQPFPFAIRSLTRSSTKPSKFPNASNGRPGSTGKAAFTTSKACPLCIRRKAVLKIRSLRFCRRGSIRRSSFCILRSLPGIPRTGRLLCGVFLRSKNCRSMA
ncbi:hypothetical protein [Allobaculum sp. Allo2]|uniref:hypothetical protein n=1 Tax=Allobaculum sp. Allo2 TaxID=2853432 RepID=UPI001F607509|nr:hypothetical protein [Allobaculum sp. Allo2]UNT93058.1 hypothetical protein KWG61_13635 [Allobaculum sp. Allo2]